MSEIKDDTHFALLGPVKVVVDGDERLIAGPVRRTLLAVLAQHPGQVLSVDLLCERVWEGTPPATAESALRVHVSQLRKALGRPELLQSVGGGYRLTVHPEQIDITVFQQRVRSGRELISQGDLEAARSQLYGAKELWRGMPFADVRGDMRADAERLLTLRSELSVDLAELHMRTQGAQADISDLTALTMERPFDERVWRLLITAQYWIGRQADALNTYQQAVAILDDELGLEPTASLRQLRDQILRHDPSLAPPRSVAVDLPTFATSFVGRSAEVRTVVGLLGQHRLVTLTGLGGLGKTRLSVVCAKTDAERYSHGVAFVSFEPLEDAALVPAVVAAALGTAAADAAGIAAALDSREMLLVFDNCEHVVDAVAEIVSTLLISCPRVRILATSRIPLNVIGETIWTTPVLETSTTGHELPDAVGLFLERASQTASQHALPPVDSPQLLEIVQLLGGVPLAIELAAAQCAALTVSDVRDRLLRGNSAIATERDRSMRHRSMTIALAGTLEHLSPAARVLLGRMTVFRAPAGVVDIEAVCIDPTPTDEPNSHPDDDSQSEPRVLADQIPGLLTELTQAGVVGLDVTGEHGRYGLLTPVRNLAPVELLRMGHAPAQVDAHHLEYFHDVVQGAIADVGGPNETSALDGLHRIIADLRAALAYAVRTNPGQGLSMAAALSQYWMRKRMHAEGRRWLRQLLRAGGDVDATIRGTALHAAGGLAWDDGDRQDARDLLQQAWDIRVNLDAPAAQALTLNNLAGLASDGGEHGEAYDIYGRAHSLFVKAGHRVGEAASLINRGIAAHKLKRLDDAAALLEEAQRVCREIGSVRMEAMALERLAAIQSERGEHRAAMTLTRSAQVIYDDGGMPEERARLCWQRSLRHRALGEHDKAHHHVRAAAQSVISDELLDAWWVPSLIETFAALQAATRPEYAAGLIGVAQRHRERSGHGADPSTVLDLPEVLAHLEDVLGEEQLAEELAVSRVKSVALVVAELAGVHEASPTVSSEPAGLYGPQLR